MPITFSAGEIFNIACQIEINGGKFYRRAAGFAKDARAEKMLLGLAEMEDHHRIIFEAMKSDLTSDEKKPKVFDIDDQLAGYLKAMADGYVFQKGVNIDKLITADTALEDVLMMALGFEKDSIIFYEGVRQMVPENLGRNKISGIIKEEMSHIVILNSELVSLK